MKKEGKKYLVAAVGGGYCSDQAFLIRTRGRTGEFPVGEISGPQTADSYGDYTVPGLLVTFVESQQCYWLW